MMVLSIVLAVVGFGLMGFGLTAMALDEGPVRLRRGGFPVKTVDRDELADLPDKGAPTRESEVE